MFDLVSAGFKPAYLLDHTVAAFISVVFYAMEAVAIISVINNYGSEEEDGVEDAINQLKTIPRRVLPFRLNNIVRFICLVTAEPRLIFNQSSEAALNPTAPDTSAPCSSAGCMSASSPSMAVAKWADAARTIKEGAAGVDNPRKKLEDIFTRGPGLPHGGIAPTGIESLTHRRQKELLDRKAYLKNFWCVK